MREQLGKYASSRRTALLMCSGVLVVLYVLAPFCWLVLTSFMHERDALTVPTQWIPTDITFENYSAFFNPTGTRAVVGSRAAEQILPSMVNSLIVAGATAMINVVIGALSGYSLARIRFPGRVSLLLLYVGSRMVPGIALIVPLYLTVKTYGLLDSRSALVSTYLTFTLPFSIWLLKNYFQSIPRDIEEAAFVDGCTWPQMLARILVPVAAPGLVAAAMFAFMTAWSDYLFAVILTSTISSKTLPVVVAGFATDVTTERTLMAASGVLAIIPPLALAFMFQKLIVQSLTSGSVTG